MTQADIYERLVKWFRRISASSSQDVKYHEKDSNTFDSNIKLHIKSSKEMIQVEFNLTIFYESTFYKTTFEDFYIYYAANSGQSKRTSLQTEKEWEMVKKYVDIVQNSIYQNVMTR